MQRVIILVGLALCLAVGTVRADDDAADALIAELAGISQLQGSFSQQQYDSSGKELIGSASGRFRLLRPGYFAWEIDAPDSQLIIANPEHVWHYDRDLETVTRRPVAGNEALTPLQVLGGDSAALRERYAITRGDAGSYVLQPLSADAGFRELRLLLVDGTLDGMEIRDNLDQRLVIAFSDVRRDGGLAPTDFAFTPPDGVDLFLHDR